MIELGCLEDVEGSKKDHDLVLFALSTCPHCRNAKSFLDNNDVAYRFVYVDQLEGDEQKAVVEEATKYNPRRSFPTLVIDDDEVLVGFTEQDWRSKLL
jgi:glutaredoxin-like protein NrdH